MYTHFLVSSVLHQEKNAVSEAAWILSNLSDISSFQPKLLPVGGLSLLRINEEKINFDKSIYEHIKSLHLSSGIKHCHKIIPLNFYTRFSEEAILDWVENIHFPDDPKWRITINKRHSSVKTRPLTMKIASNINSGTVDLKNPDIIIQIEIIANNVGLSVLEPWKILQIKQFLDLK